MRIPLAITSLTVVWCLSSARFTLADLVMGFLLSAGILGLIGRGSQLHASPRSLARALPFLLRYWLGFLRSCLQVARQVLQPLSRLRPAVLAVPIESRTEEEVALLANLLTYSPGTLCLEISEDGSVMYVHVMSMDDAAEVRRHVREDLERRVLEVMR